MNAKIEYYLARPRERREITEALRRVVEERCPVAEVMRRVVERRQ